MILNGKDYVFGVIRGKVSEPERRPVIIGDPFYIISLPVGWRKMRGGFDMHIVRLMNFGDPPSRRKDAPLVWQLISEATSEIYKGIVEEPLDFSVDIASIPEWLAQFLRLISTTGYTRPDLRIYLFDPGEKCTSRVLLQIVVEQVLRRGANSPKSASHIADA
ncbi:MAG: hypothetical protein KatS3mg054_0077 [Chloroflexus sp.]|nr:MAG: hypothetical protein KatS3mg054_0077 [Chloroflexus sp.]